MPQITQERKEQPATAPHELPQTGAEGARPHPVDRERELDIQVALALGYKYISGPTNDYDGPIKNPPDLLVPPGFVFDGYAYPARGVIPATWHVPHFSSDQRQAWALMERGIARFGSVDFRGVDTLAAGKPVTIWHVHFGDAPSSAHQSFERSVCWAFVHAANAQNVASKTKRKQHDN